VNTRFEKDQLSAEHYNRKWREIIKQMPQGGDYCFYMRQYGYDIIKDAIEPESLIFDFACGLGIIDIQLHNEKDCFICGCDISKVAVDYLKCNLYGGHTEPPIIKVADRIFKNPDKPRKEYDYILAIYFLEHVPDPVDWLDHAFKFGKKVIFSIPNNFKQAGEHELMAWHDWPSFYGLFRDFKLTRIDEGKYHKWLPEAYHHPTFICEKN